MRSKQRRHIQRLAKRHSERTKAMTVLAADPETANLNGAYPDSKPKLTPEEQKARAAELGAKASKAVLTTITTVAVAPIVAGAIVVEGVGFVTGANVRAFMRGFFGGADKYDAVRDGKKD